MSERRTKMSKIPTIQPKVEIRYMLYIKKKKEKVYRKEAKDERKNKKKKECARMQRKSIMRESKRGAVYVRAQE